MLPRYWPQGLTKSTYFIQARTLTPTANSRKYGRHRNWMGHTKQRRMTSFHIRIVQMDFGPDISHRVQLSNASNGLAHLSFWQQDKLRHCEELMPLHLMFSIGQWGRLSTTTLSAGQASSTLPIIMPSRFKQESMMLQSLLWKHFEGTLLQTKANFPASLFASSEMKQFAM